MKRPRLWIALGAGIAAGVLCPLASLATRGLIGWNVGVWLYLALLLRMMTQSDAHRLRRHAVELADSMGAVLLLAAMGAIASMGAVALELSQVQHGQDAAQSWPYLLLAISTVTCSWLLLPAEFALAYASLYHSAPGKPHGLEFPGDEEHPDYTDFMYFAITLAATSQTSDVAVSTRPMRRLVLVQAVLSFVFNTSVLALTINILAGLIS